MTTKELKILIEKIKLQIQILTIQLQIALLKSKLTIPNLDAPTKIILHHSASNHNFEQTNLYHKKLWGFKSALSKSGEEEI